MKYYIIGNKIKAFETELDSNFFKYQELTPEQSQFYIENPTATKSEVLNLQVFDRKLEETRNEKIKTLKRNVENAKKQGINVIDSSNVYLPLIGVSPTGEESNVKLNMQELKTLADTEIELGISTKETYEFDYFNYDDENGNPQTPRTVTYSEILEVILNIAQRELFVSGQYQLKYSAILQANSIESLNQIDLNVI